MDAEPVRLILFARYPVAGQAKTRLIPAVGAHGAAKIHKLLAQKSVSTIIDAIKQRSDARFILSYTGAQKEKFQDWLGEDAIDFEEQVKGDLTDRLLALLNPAPVIFFGSDTPDLSQRHVTNAIDAMKIYDVVIGPALDGGYYLIGMKKAYEGLLNDMPWSSDQVLPTTLDRCGQMGLNVHLLEPLSDCDLPEDLDRWPDLKINYMDVTL